MKISIMVIHILITILLVGCYVGKSEYVGAEKDGKPHGQGTMTWNYGKYVGELKEGKQHGHGIFYYSKGSIFYEGEWENGKQHGLGTYYDLKGGKYVGEWKYGGKNGQGTYTYPDGGKYEGEWKGGKYNGQGTYTYPDGHTFIGQWRKGKKHGQGAMYWAPPHDEQKKPYKTLEGEWNKDKRMIVTHFDLNGKIIGWFYIYDCVMVSFKNGKPTWKKYGSNCTFNLLNKKIVSTNYIPEKYKDNKVWWFRISGEYGHCNKHLLE
jgi:hypothetical protein